VESPLFNGYIFTLIDKQEWEKVHFTEGILTFVRMEGKPAFLREEQVELIRKLLADPGDLVITEEDLQAGEFVEVVAGPLSGMKGEVLNYRGRKRLAIRLEQLGKSILVQLPVAYVKRTSRD